MHLELCGVVGEGMSVAAKTDGHRGSTAGPVSCPSEAEPSDLESCLYTAIDCMAHGLIIYDQFSRLVFVNSRYCEIYGLVLGPQTSEDAHVDDQDNLITVGMHITDVIRRQGQAMDLANM